MSTKTALIGILALLQRLEDNYQIRTEGEVTFKEAKNSVTDLINAPEPAPVEIVKTEVATSTIAAAVTARLDEILGPFAVQLGTIADKIDGFEDHMAMLIAAEEAEETAPAGETAPA